MLVTMKTVTTRDLVTGNGEPKLVVTKPAKRRRKTRADLEREARSICPEGGPTVNFTEVLRELKAG
jgi:hypothetical protein